jgi:hypothetical protein
LRQATRDRQVSEDALHWQPSQRPRLCHRHGFGGCVVDDHQTLQHADLSRAIEDEIANG